MNLCSYNPSGPDPQLPAEILKETTSDTRVVRIEMEQYWKWPPLVRYLSHGKGTIADWLKNIHSVLERNEMEAWQKLIRIDKIMISSLYNLSLSEALSERGMPNLLTEKSML